MKNLSSFKKIVWDHYRKHGRDLPWRTTRDGYRILVSEVMLQQTQVDRVLPKYANFIKRFQSFKALASASTADVIHEWQGLGYNRRALNLKRAAQAIVEGHHGKLPKTYAELAALPGIGPYTAGALMAFVHDAPHPIIETNIRTVYIHHFFPAKKVSDKELMEVITTTLDVKKPREWYYALMDYGSHLKKTVGNASRGSAHYTKQSRFEGSNRQLRGMILRELTKGGRTASSLTTITKRSRIETEGALNVLRREGLLEERGGRFRLRRD